jgi:hypothetical protein
VKEDLVISDDFLKEMQRSVPAATVRETLAQRSWWGCLSVVLEDQERLALADL